MKSLNLNSSTLKGVTGLYSTSKNSIIGDFLATSKKVSLGTEHTEIQPATLNRYGFVVGLHGGYACTENKRLERELPDATDLSLNQNKGFSVSVWILIKPQTAGGVHRLILKKGNTIDDITPSIGILPNGENLFVKIYTSKHRIETLFSSKVIEHNRLYNLITTFAIDHYNNLTEVSMYIDGLLDSEITVTGEPLHNQGNIVIGKADNLTYGFNGVVADILLIPRVMNEIEINQIYKASLLNLHNTKEIRSYDIFERKFEHDLLLQKYSEYSGN